MPPNPLPPCLYRTRCSVPTEYVERGEWQCAYGLAANKGLRCPGDCDDRSSEESELAVALGDRYRRRFIREERPGSRLQKRLAKKLWETFRVRCDPTKIKAVQGHERSSPTADIYRWEVYGEVEVGGTWATIWVVSFETMTHAADPRPLLSVGRWSPNLGLEVMIGQPGDVALAMNEWPDDHPTTG